LISHGVPPLRGVKQGSGGKIQQFSIVNISKTVADTAKLQLITNRKSHMGFTLTPRSMTLNCC